MSLQDFAAGFGSEKKMTGSVRIQGAEDAMPGNAVFKQKHAVQSVLLVDEEHFVDFTGGIVHKDKQIKKDTRQIGDPLVSTAVKVKHHTGEWFTGPAFSVFAAGRRFFNKPRRLKGTLDEGVAAGNVVVLGEFFLGVSDGETSIVGSVQLQNCLEFLKRNPFWTWRFHASVKDAVVAVVLVPGFPAFHGSVGDSDNIGGLSPEDLFGNGL